MTDRPSPSLDPAELLAHRAWMRRFAAALVGAESEDLVQDTWVRVLSARDPALARPRAWLASVMRNAARMGQRGAIRREQREAQVARAEALASTDDLAAQAELEQLAVRAVLALTEPYRQALLLCYVGGLEPSEIARQLGLPPATVRSHIARGLAEVRAELDRRHGRREAWVALLAPGALARSGTAAAVVGGGIGMSTKWIAVAAALAAALIWVGRLGRTHAPHAPESSAASAGGLAAPAPLSPETMTEPMAEPSRAAMATKREALPANALPFTATELLVHVTWARDGSPAADVALRVESLDVEPYRLAITGTTDASGTARFVALPPGEQRVDTLRDASGSVVLDGNATVNGESQTLELAIPLALDVDCRVVDREGAGVAGAEVWLSDFGGSGMGLVVGRTDAGGRLALRDVPGQHRSLVARAPGHAPSTQREYRGLPGSRLALELVLPGPGASLAGVVQDALGMPLAGAEIVIGEELGGARSRRATSDADGSFLVHGLAPGSLELQARAPGYGTAQAEVELAPDQIGSCTLVLPPEARVAGVARDGGGRPLAGVHITGTGGGWRYVDFFKFGGSRTRTAADGSFVLCGLEAGGCWLEANGGSSGHAETALGLLAGEEAQWDVVLTAGGAVAGVVLDERGAPLSRWHVAAVDPGDPDHWLRSAYSDAAGRFRMEDCPAQPFVLALRAPEEEWGDPVLVLEDFHVGDEALVLRALDACRPSAFVEGRLVASDGAPLVEVELGCEPMLTGHFGTTHVPDADGRFRIGPRRSGEYTLWAEAVLDGAAGFYSFRRPLRFALQAGETKDLGDVVLERCGWLHVRAVAKGGGALPAGTVLEDLQLRGEIGGSISFTGLQAGSEPTSAGTYIVSVREGIWRAPETEVEVRPGETTELELEFEPTTERLIEVVFPDGVSASVLELRVLDADGRSFDDRESDGVSDGRYSAWVGGLLPGSYSVEARASGELSASGELHVLDLAEDETPLVLILR